MSLERALTWSTIAHGARELNENIANVGLPITSMFDMRDYQSIEAGHKIAGNLLYKREISNRIQSGLTPTRDDIVDPYEHFELEWYIHSTVLNMDWFDIEKNLGGVTINELDSNPRAMQRVPAGGRNTLFNLLSPRLLNLNKTFREDMERDFLQFGVSKNKIQGPLGIDKITEPDTAYGGLGYKACGTSPWKSDVLGVPVYLNNPITKTLTRAIASSDYRAIGRDVQKVNSNLTSMDNSKDWTILLVSPYRYDEKVLAEWREERRRNSPTDVEAGPIEAFKDSRLRLKFVSVPMLEDDNIVYFYRDSAIKRCQQRAMVPRDTLITEKIPGEFLVKWTMYMMYQYRCDMRCHTGWIRGTS